MRCKLLEGTALPIYLMCGAEEKSIKHWFSLMWLTIQDLLAFTRFCVCYGGRIAWRRGSLMVSAFFSRSCGRVSTLAGDIALCSWARHLSLIVSLPTQVYNYKWVPERLMVWVTLRWTNIPSRGSRNTPSRFMLLKTG